MTPKAVVNLIEISVGVAGPPRQLRDSIEKVLLESGMGVAAAAESVDRLKEKVTREIILRGKARNEMGEIAIIHLRGSDLEIVHGSSFVFNDDKDEIKQSKINRISVAQIQQHIQALTFGQFETFGRAILREIGCKTAKVTPHAGDQGIDFYGDLTVGGLIGADPAILKLMHETRVVLVGQAKHYPKTSIGPSVVRELVGALSLSRTHTFSKLDLDLLADVHLRPFSPIVAMLFTTGDFTKGARILARQAGLIAFSCWQLAVFLADRGIGLVDGLNGREFKPEVFDSWLEQV